MDTAGRTARGVLSHPHHSGPHTASTGQVAGAEAVWLRGGASKAPA